MKKISIAVAFAVFAPLFSFAAGEAQNANARSHYLLPVEWDSETNSLKPNGNISVTKENLLKDTGSGSQFYARVINFSNKAKVFPDGDAKLFLGAWKAAGDEKKISLKITVPYFPDGQKVIIFNADDKKAVLAANVSKFAKTKPTAQNGQKTVQAPLSQTYRIGGRSAAYWWTMRFLVLAVLIGGGYFLWRWRKKKKEAQAGSAVAGLAQSKK